MKRRFALVIAALACAALAVAAGAIAGPPSHFTDSVDYAWDDPGSSPTSCGSNVNRHRPFKLSHGSRRKSGRGCSGRGMDSLVMGLRFSTRSCR